MPDSWIKKMSKEKKMIDPFVEKLVTTTDGLLQFGRVYLHQGEKNHDWSKLDTVTTDENGQYVQSSLPGKGTLIHRGGTDILTGQPYEGLLLADAESSVISPLTTLDWALERNGHSEESRDQIIDGLVNAAYEVLTCTTMNDNARGLNSVTDTAPHQVIRSSMREAQDVAKSQVILNRALGGALSGLWNRVNQHELLAIDPLHKFQASVLRFACALEQGSNTDRHSFLETDLGEALERMHSGSGEALGSLLNSGKELRGTDYYSFIELLNAEA